MFKGNKGFLIADFDTRVLIPYGDSADLTYYKPRSEDDVIPPLGHFQKEWTNACKGDLKTSCDFDYSGTLIEQMLLASWPTASARRSSTTAPPAASPTTTKPTPCSAASTAPAGRSTGNAAKASILAPGVCDVTP